MQSEDTEWQSTNVFSSQKCDAEVWEIFSLEISVADDDDADYKEELPAPHKYSRKQTNGPVTISMKDATRHSKRYHAAIGLEINVEEAARWSSGPLSSNTGSPATVARLFQPATTS
jgi:hypothetical protein